MLHSAKRLDAATRRQAYRGNVLVFRHLPSLVALCAHFESSETAAIATLASSEHGAEGAASARAALCSAFEADERVTALWRAALREAGVATERTCWDRVRLRVQQSGGAVDRVDDPSFAHGRFSSTLPLHRDTWASNVRCQLNCWTPLRPIAADRTMAIYPSFFERAVSNNSAEWDFDELRRRRRCSSVEVETVGTAAAAYPQLPALAVQTAAEAKALGKILEADEFPIVVKPGDLVVFSGAHLHRSIPNNSLATRFSSEVRLVDRDDDKCALLSLSPGLLFRSNLIGFFVYVPL